MPSTVQLVATTCTVTDCVKPLKRNSRRWCSMHCERVRRTGTTDRAVPTLWERFWPKVNADGVCWQWTAATNHLGYGQIGLPNSRDRGMAHRVAWELLVGPVPDGLELDHLCRNPGCVNPDHLEPVTHAENMRRAPWSAAQFQASKTHCPHGHPYAGSNVYVNPKGSRECRTCIRNRKAVAA